MNPTTADFFESLGFNIFHGYGMSENAPLNSVGTPGFKNNVSVGLSVKYTDIKILNPNEEGIGEIAVKSPSIMLGYYKNPGAAKEVITEDGWLLTGDLGSQDERGFLYIKGRKDETGGEHIFAVVSPSRKTLSQDYPGKISTEGSVSSEGDELIHSLVKKEIAQVNRRLPGYKKIAGFTIRYEGFEKNAQKKIRRFLYKEYEKT
ncbi:MAG: AMP-binding protein [Treponema sp.]|nr:AMP-binding protein [Treponema sp.]